jgi:hypothetical protein
MRSGWYDRKKIGDGCARMTDYQGTDPADVAKIIVRTAAEKLRKKSGDDVDVCRYISQEQ